VHVGGKTNRAKYTFQDELNEIVDAIPEVKALGQAKEAAGATEQEALSSTKYSFMVQNCTKLVLFSELEDWRMPMSQFIVPVHEQITSMDLKTCIVGRERVSRKISS